MAGWRRAEATVDAMTVLVVDVGTSGVRAARVEDDGSISHLEHRPVVPSRPAPGVVEVDQRALSAAVLGVCDQALERGRVAAVGVAAQRATTLLWQRTSGDPVGPGIGWQDLRTVGHCLMLRRQGFRLAPNQSATKLSYLLDTFDPARAGDLCFGTVETFVAWTLSNGAVHASDATNAAVSGLVLPDASDYDPAVLEALKIPRSLLPRLVDSSGVLGEAGALAGAPPIAALVGDQQVSLIGQGCLAAGEAKVTFGTGGMLDCSTGLERPAFPVRGEAGTFPIVTWQAGGVRRWGVEAVMLSAGSCVEWLVQLGLLDRPAQSDELAASVRDAAGAIFVPALDGLGTPVWDFGARGAFSGLTGAIGRAELVRAVLEGIAQRGADLLEAVETDTAGRVELLRVDGGMSANATFLQLLADATRRPVEPSAVLEATTLGAAYLAGTAVGIWESLEQAASTRRRREPILPRRGLDRDRWLEARARAERTVPALSALQF